MNREIRFRVLSRTSHWVYGKERVHPDEVVRDHIYPFDRFFAIFYDARRETFGEFTGLHDDNNEEIWEGDILRWSSTQEPQRWVVERTRGGWNPFIDDMTTDKPYRYIVIGNIYEHPELVREAPHCM